MEDFVKVAYGIGCLNKLSELGVDPELFVKTAAAQGDHNIRLAADAILCVAAYQNTDPAGTEKVASLIANEPAEQSLIQRLGLG